MTGASGGGPDVPAADPAIRWSVGSQEHTDQGSENGRLGAAVPSEGSAVGIQLVGWAVRWWRRGDSNS